MMTDKQEHSPVDTTKYEQGYQLKQQDTLDIALLANAVGSELTQVDNYNVGGLKKATQISKDKVFRSGPIQTPGPSQPPQTPQPVQALKRATPVGDVSTKKPPVAPPAEQNLSVNRVEYNSHELKEILSKLDKLENKIVAVEDIFTNMIDTITKSTKQITLTINNDKNK